MKFVLYSSSTWKYLVFLIQIIFQSFSTGNITIPEHFQWLETSVASASRLYCPKCCPHACGKYEFIPESSKVALCCAEYAKPFWNFPKYSHLQTNLHMEYNDDFSELYIKQPKPINSVTLYVLRYNGKRLLSCLPYNICEYHDLVTVNLSDNKIQNLPNISCLLNLDTLDLSKNNIRNINSSSFSQLIFLRYLDLSDNFISYLKPGAFNYRPGSLMHIKMRRNRLYSIDLTNFHLGYWFYEVDYAQNKISEITNKLNWNVFRKDKLVGGGYVKFKANYLSHFPTPKEFGLRNMNQAYILAFSYSYQFGDNPWHCDCSLFQYIKSIELASLKFKGFIKNNLTCSSPPQVKGYTVGDSTGNSSFYDLLICNITMKNKCPPRCYCFQQPSKKRVVVNCYFSHRSKLPIQVPDFDNLDINLSRNKIKTVEYLIYLRRTKSIDLSYNRIVEIDPLIFEIKTLTIINLYQNRIKVLDKSVRQKSPCNIAFGEIKIVCTCEMLWIKIWLERGNSQSCNKNHVTCEIKSKQKDAMLLSKEDFCPVESNDSFFLIALPVATLLICFVIYQRFKYEIKLVVRKIQNQSNATIMNSEIDFDVYISLNIENNAGTAWAIHTLNVYLEQHGMKTCIPYRDFEPGGIQVEQIYKNIIRSRFYIVVLTEDYQESQFKI
ncbi:unnamed protein product [Mytilus edulis]|uniref:TIR domain-containing protein n=1 Tax=Mytilus edulis TaxID=6550 RepID=A0A8S3SGH4_MYTED|nr:unnamed protein product [Mytilus edulis]